MTLEGEVVASGGDFGSGFVSGGVSESTAFCALDSSACVIVTLVPDNYPGETSWELVDVVTGAIILSGDGTGGSFGTADCVPGCNDAGACNYAATADINDGSCDYSCVGCTDSAAANYDPEATIDFGCIYCDPGTFILTVDMSDSFGDGWNGAQYGIFSDELGEVYTGSLDSAFTGDGLTSGTDLICLAPGCYNFQITSGSDPAEITVALSTSLERIMALSTAEAPTMDLITDSPDNARSAVATTLLQTTSIHRRPRTTALANCRRPTTMQQMLNLSLVTFL